MSYEGISIREALDKLNAPNNGWFLPQIQRQYVWGDRHESEDYVCLLLDSVLRGYPIGGIVLWETDQKVPYRQFVGDYAPGHFARQVDEGRWAAHKSLVYDGQQRLQTLYSVLRHRFNGRVLYFDMLFDQSQAEPDETGFLFRDAESTALSTDLRMTELVSMRCNEREKLQLEDRLTSAILSPMKDQTLRIRTHLGDLWRVFVDTGVKSIAYFPVKADDSKEVNEVFRRLNTGGIALTQIELVLGKLKEKQSNYEEQLWEVSEKIFKHSGGIRFPSPEILQFIHLLVKATVRIDENRLTTGDITAFQRALQQDMQPLIEFFSAYLQGLFRINHAPIVPRWLAILPIAVYLTELKRNEREWRIKAMKTSDLTFINQYFLLSQFCDWNTQTMVNAFAREAAEAAKAGSPFPLKAIRQIAIEKNRNGDLQEIHLTGQRWFAAKVLMPSRSYVFHENKPQVDHIFPSNLQGMDDLYREAVDVLWNLQPMPAEVNNYKRARHPQEFFLSQDGSKYWPSYDFIPEPQSDIWRDHSKFIAGRRKAMLGELSRLYGLSLRPESAPRQSVLSNSAV